MQNKLINVIITHFFLSCFFVASSAWACTVSVPSGGNIQGAIDTASAGDIICLAQGGVYAPAVTIQINKSITLKAPDPYTADLPVIDGGGILDQIIKITADNVVLDGLEVRNGTGDLIRSDDVSGVIVRNCDVHNSTGDEAVQLDNCTDCVIECNITHDIAQDGICMSYSVRGVIRDNEIYNSDSENAALHVYNSYDMSITCNRIHDNTAANGIFLYYNYGTTHTVENNLIVNNTWQGGTRNYDEADGNSINIYKPLAYSTYSIKHNTLDGNTGQDKGGNPTGNALYVNDKNSIDYVTSVTDNIITNHNGYGIRTYYGAVVNYAYNDLWKNADNATDGTPSAGSGNIEADPLFNADYTLQAASPCKGTGISGSDMGVAFGACPGCGPTLITLSSFAAVSTFKKVTVSWTTASELDNAGFNIYRSDAADGAYAKINASIIPAEGAPEAGASYSFTDIAANPWKKTYYKLEDIDLNGTSTMHGPVMATPRVSGIFKSTATRAAGGLSTP